MPLRELNSLKVRVVPEVLVTQERKAKVCILFPWTCLRILISVFATSPPLFPIKIYWSFLALEIARTVVAIYEQLHIIGSLIKRLEKIFFSLQNLTLKYQ